MPPYQKGRGRETLEQRKGEAVFGFSGRDPMGLAHRAAAKDDAAAGAHELELRAARVIGGQRVAGVEGLAVGGREVGRPGEDLGPDGVGDEVEAAEGAAERAEGAGRRVSLEGGRFLDRAFRCGLESAGDQG